MNVHDFVVSIIAVDDDVFTATQVLENYCRMHPLPDLDQVSSDST